jgi:hypothetical protein
MSDKKPASEVPDHVIESFARCILPAILKYFDSEEGQREFAEWKKHMNKKRNETEN